MLFLYNLIAVLLLLLVVFEVVNLLLNEDKKVQNISKKMEVIDE